MSDASSEHATVVGVILSTLIFSGFVVGLRVYTRTCIQQGIFGLDDWFIVLAWVLVLAYNICMLISVSHGFGRHRSTLTDEQFIETVKFEVVAQFFAVLAYIPGKISVAICLGRIFPGRKLHFCLWVIAGANFLIFMAAAIFELAQCSPTARQWDPSIPGSCADPKYSVDVNLPSGIIGAASDFTLALIPWYYIARLQMPRHEKFAVGVALSMGLGAGAFAVVKTHYLTTLNLRSDYAYDTAPLMIWSVAEQCAINVAASIPMLRPLLLKYMGSKTGSSDRSERSGTVAYFARLVRKRSAISDSTVNTLAPRTGSDDGRIWVEQQIEVDTYPVKPSGVLG